MHRILSEVWAWYPPVGVFIAILGLAAVLVPFFRDLGKMSKEEKAFWTSVMFALVLLEMKSIYQDRSFHDGQQAQAREEQAEHFEEIGKGIKATITNSQIQFEATTNELMELSRLSLKKRR